MNIMLMVVSERTREIGLRKALGARRRDLLWQILAESVILSVSGGLIGTALGFAVAIGLSSLTPITAAVHPWSVVLGIAMTAAVGLFFGLYPASRAAALDPITGAGPAPDPVRSDVPSENANRWPHTPTAACSARS